MTDWRVLAFPAMGVAAFAVDSAFRRFWEVDVIWAAIVVALFVLPVTDAVASEMHVRSLAREVKQMREQESNARREIASMAHDLNGPLSTVSSYLDRIVEGLLGPVSEDARAAARSASAAQARARSMVEMTLLKHVESLAVRPLEAWPVDLCSLIQDVTDALRAEIAASRAEVTVEPLPRVLGDSTMLFRVFENLLQNAVKYACPGETPVIAITAVRAGDRAVIAVRDHGIGIPVEECERVFDLDARAANGAAVTTGHGLGLATVRRLVHQLGGEVWVDTATTDGAMLRLSLPLAG